MASTPREDMHVHSNFSDDAHSSIDDNLDVAVKRGLRRLVCVDHVRRDTAWVPEFVRAVRAAAERVRGTGLEVSCGLEAKMLDGHGTLDLPQALDGVEFVLVADHQFPLGERCYSPAAIRQMLADGAVTREQLVDALIRATCLALMRHPRVIVAHLFSILPKVGLSEADVSDAALETLAAVARRQGAWVEVSEKWRCPSPRALSVFAAAGVVLVASTDAHQSEDVGRYAEYVPAALAHVEATRAAR